ncbi:MAG: tetratricopeptide repeat protein [Ferruginibacter sp.]|nr:tetratricopeptide repeat protein [Ferruginibacter sp.]
MQNKKRNYALFLFLFFSFATSNAQVTIKLDSLKAGLKNEKKDTNTLKKYLILIDSLDSDNLEAKKEIANWIVINSKDRLSQKIHSMAYSALGNIYAELNEYPKAIAYYDSVSSIAKANTFLDVEANVQFALSKIYVYHLTAIDALKAIDNAIQICLQTKDYKLLAKSLFQKSFIIQYDYSNRNIDTGYEKIFALKEESISISKSINDTNAILRGYIGLAESYADNNEFDKSIEYLKEADNFKVPGIKGKSIIGYYFVFGKIYLLKGIALKSSLDIKKSIPFFEKSHEYANMYNNLDWKANNAGWLSSAYYKINEFKTAFDYLKKKNAYQDTINDQENSKAINELKRKYDIQLKENEITKLSNQNQQKATLNKILIGTSAALLFIGFISYRNFKNKQKVSSQKQELQKQKIIELEKDKQLSAIDAMLHGQEEERSRIAKDLHDGLGGMLSGTKLSFINMKENLVLTPENAMQFDKSLSMLDNTIADLRKVAHNLMPEALVKFGLQDAVSDFCNSIQSSTNLKVIYQPLGEKRKLSNTAEVFTYRIIQELVNNVVKHANATQIIVQLSTNNNKVGLVVEDDGKGFDMNALANSKGAGMDNIKYRVQYFNGTIDTVTSAGNGASVNIELNV